MIDAKYSRQDNNGRRKLTSAVVLHDMKIKQKSLPRLCYIIFVLQFISSTATICCEREKKAGFNNIPVY